MEFNVYYYTGTRIFLYSKLKSTNDVESLAATLEEACRQTK